jgi:hypothetical protein
MDAAQKEMSVWLYGYQEGSEEDSPLRLKEVTIAANAKSLRRIARFLEFAAEQLEKHGVGFGHEHLCDFDPGARKAPSLVVTGPIVRTQRGVRGPRRKGGATQGPKP